MSNKLSEMLGMFYIKHSITKEERELTKIFTDALSDKHQEILRLTQNSEHLRQELETQKKHARYNNDVYYEEMEAHKQCRRELEEEKGHAIIAEDKAKHYEGRNEAMMVLLGRNEIELHESDKRLCDVRMLNGLQAQSIGILSRALEGVEQERDELAAELEACEKHNEILNQSNAEVLTYVERLRDGLLYFKPPRGTELVCTGEGMHARFVDRVLDEAPSTSLQQHDNTVIEMCAKEADPTSIKYLSMSDSEEASIDAQEYIAKAIRALKETGE